MLLSRFRTVVAALALATACGGDDGEDGGGTGTDDGSTTAADTTSTTTATTTTTGMSATTTGVDESTTDSGEESSSSDTGPVVDLEHGFVLIHLQRAADEPADPFVGTERIIVTLNYEQCLFDFYVANPDYAQGSGEDMNIWGTLDEGGEGWFDRLCEVDVPGLVDCSVATFEQQLEPIPVLRITYLVTEPLEDMMLPFGPLPTAELAACTGDVLPTVRLSSGDLVRGFDAQNVDIWQGSTFDPAIAVTDDPAPIVVDVVVE